MPFSVVAKNQHLICVSRHLLVKYVKESLQKRFLPLIKSHDNGPVIWPYLTSYHYGKLAMERYKQNDVNIVPKTAHPPNCLELRVIEKYWAVHLWGPPK